MERPDEVLASIGVDTRLAADGGVHHGEHGRGNLNHLYSTQPGRCNESRQVRRCAATQPNDDVGSSETAGAKRLPRKGGDRCRLGVLAGRHFDQKALDAAIMKVVADSLRGR